MPRRVLIFATLLLALAALPAWAGGRAGYRLEAGQRFALRFWGEQVVWSGWGLEQVAGGEVEYGPAGWYWSPYTGVGYAAEGWWVQLQLRGRWDGWGLALIGGWSW